MDKKPPKTALTQWNTQYDALEFIVPERHERVTSLMHMGSLLARHTSGLANKLTNFAALPTCFGVQQHGTKTELLLRATARAAFWDPTRRPF